MNSRNEAWQSWIAGHSSEMQHPVDFEVRFVKEILTQIPEVTPDSVYPQYPFLDSEGRIRRIDFLISDPAKGFAIAIELDGFTKLKEYKDWEDFLYRQNELLANVKCQLLRYANKYWLNNPKKVIAEIRAILKEQSQAFRLKELRDAEQKKATAEVKQQGSEVRKIESEVLQTLQRAEALVSRAEEEHKSATNKISLAAYAGIGIVIFAAACLIFGRDIARSSSAPEKTENAVLAAASREEGIQKEASAPMQKESQIAGNVRDNQAVSRGDDKLFNENNDPIDYSQSQQPAFPLSVTQSSKSPGQLTSTLSVKEALWPINEGDLQPYIGSQVVLCGQLVQVKSYKKWTFLNFVHSYPEAVFTGVIADESVTEFQGINRLLNSNVCISGILTQYRNKYQINLTVNSQWVRNEK